jgi:hypothetical protein
MLFKDDSLGMNKNVQGCWSLIGPNYDPFVITEMPGNYNQLLN